MHINISYDIVVAGGGMAGICAAIAAARCGQRVALVHDRPLLGGNASGELRIHIAGADGSGTSNVRYVRESGIIDELRLENLYRNPADSHDVLSLIFREQVEAESNIDLYLNTSVRAVKMASSKVIDAVKADQITTEKQFIFKAAVFIDCTGDGFIAAKAGALFRIGRESCTEFNESLAPQLADLKTLPSNVQFYLKDMGKPTPFTPPSWAYRYERDNDLPFRSMERSKWQFGNVCGGFWWLSTGGDKSIISDNEDIYRELLRVVMGLWDHMKNHGDHGAKNFALNWISPLTGKRESRRLEGDHWLTQNDVLGAKLFKDRIAYGGWPIDIHPPEGIFSKEPPSFGTFLSRPYTIPLRCLYSKNIKNLMFAGRNASFTHVGLGSPRVMATCAVIGQAAGVAAAIAVSKKLSPRRVRKNLIEDVQQELLRQGAFIPYCSNDDKSDLARCAKVLSSSEMPLSVQEIVEDKCSLGSRPFQLFPISGKSLDTVEVLIESHQSTTLRAGIRRAHDIWDFSSRDDLAQKQARTTGNGQEWLQFKFGLKNLARGLYWLWIEGDAKAEWCANSVSPVGLVRGHRSKLKRSWSAVKLKHHTMRGVFIFRLLPLSSPYSSDNVINGVTRPEKWTNAWISTKIDVHPEWLQLVWAKNMSVSKIHLTFDGQWDSNVTWPPPLGVFGCNALPAVVKRYDIQVMLDGAWKTIIYENANYHVRRIHYFKNIVTDKIRIRVYETNGVPEARIFEVRIY